MANAQKRAFRYDGGVPETWQEGIERVLRNAPPPSPLALWNTALILSGRAPVEYHPAGVEPTQRGGRGDEHPMDVLAQDLALLDDRQRVVG